jgi:tetratricopeptide (TPR) repeat protein
MKERVSDSADVYFALAEEKTLREENYDEAIRFYKQVALNDSADNKLKALYAMGLLYEKKLGNKAEAFRLYNSLIFADPVSEYAKKVKPKVDAYVLENRITKDSLSFWVNRDFVKIPLIQTAPDTLKTQHVPEKPFIDSTQSRLPQELNLDENESRPSPPDSASVKFRKNLKDTPSNELDGNIKKKGKDAIKEEDKVIKDE